MEKRNEQCEQYLRDCGCPDELVPEYMRLVDEGRTQEQIYFLKRLRCKTMDEVHECNKKVDCIDFIIHELEKNEGGYRKNE